ncbi:hypothetical protein Sjap_018736 [Stephania japonica]|uniref:Methyltransferase type 11 domain-containing protein n=1 Tax=Stephania japonica TaxID=461633 RepID=A0AAP0I8G9_9MAGN
MATRSSCPTTSLLQISTGRAWRRSYVFEQLKPRTAKPLSVKRFRVSATAIVEAKPVRVVEFLVLISNGKGITRKNVLACPICYSPLTQNTDPALAKESIAGIDFDCSICKKLYNGNDIYLDLTIGSGAREYKEATPASSELFRYEVHFAMSAGTDLAVLFILKAGIIFPSVALKTCFLTEIRTQLVSFLYERGWRQSFNWGGFPGPDKEFEMAKNCLKPVLGGNVVDASCGSGLFSRLFVKSGLFSQVFALDFSENMLRQCYDFVETEEGFPKEKLVLVRADISRLPFVSNSIDALHAGAALHCWPSPSSAVADISRVLKPGGIFVATTFILDSIYPIFPLPMMLLKRYAARVGSGQVFLSERELEDLCKTCGLVGYTCTRNGSFVMLSARKPSSVN